MDFLVTWEHPLTKHILEIDHIKSVCPSICPDDLVIDDLDAQQGDGSESTGCAACTDVAKFIVVLVPLIILGMVSYLLYDSRQSLQIPI